MIPRHRDYTKAQGDDLARRAQSRAEHLNIPLLQATQEIISEDHARKYRDQNGPWPYPEDVNGTPGMTEAFIDISNLLAAMRRESGKVDAELAAEGCNNGSVIGVDGVYLAAMYAIMRRANQIVANLSPGKTDDNQRLALSLAMREMPGTASIYNATRRQPMTAEALREMYPQFSFAARYDSRPHSYTDNAGNLVKKYAL